MPDVVRVPGGYNTSDRPGSEARFRSSRGPHHPPHGCRGKVKAGAGKYLGDLHHSQARAKDLQTAHQVAHEIGESIHRLWQPDERIRPFLVESSRPGGDGERCHEEGLGGLDKGPAAGGSEFQDRQPGRGWIIGSAMGPDLLHAEVLDADLLAQDRDFPLEPLDFG